MLLQQRDPILVADLDFISGLEKVAELRRKFNPPGDQLVLASAGGSYAVIHLKSRLTTHDVDIFHPDRKVEDKLQTMSEEAARELHWPESHYWLNGQVHGVIDGEPEYKDLYNQALNEKVTLFHSDTLVIYAFPVEWQLHRKLMRLYTLRKGLNSWQNDPDWLKHLGDAVDLLQYQLKVRKLKSLTDETIQAWYGGVFKGLFVGDVLKSVDGEYFRRFGAHGIEFVSVEKDVTITKKDK